MKIRILIVDETAFVRDALKRALRRFLKEVETYDAINGHRALAVLRSNKIDLIISAWEAPEMSGAELLRSVRESENYSKIPFIVMSDSLDRNLVTAGANAGASDFLAKPFSPDDVQKKVSKLLAKCGFQAQETPSSQNSGFGSIEVLTTNGAVTASAEKPRPLKQAAAATKAAANPRSRSSAAKAGNFSGTAEVYFDGHSTLCDITDLSLTAFSGIIQRANMTKIPQVFDRASANIMDAKGAAIGELKVFVNAIQAIDATPDADGIRINLRFIDNAPAQFETLSKAIART